MCCCCPQAVSALFCLWAKSGFSKASVAGALTFFPPEPPLYKFNRLDKDGNLLDDDEEVDDDTNTDDKQRANLQSEGLSLCDSDSDNEDELDSDLSLAEDEDGQEYVSKTTGKKPNPSKSKDSEQRSSSKDNNGNGNDAYEVEEEDDDIHDFNLAERAAKLRKRGAAKNAQATKDQKLGITYDFVPDERLVEPPPFSGTIEAAKIGPNPKTKNFIAAVIYRLRPERQTAKTKTIIYSHGNATDIGAMNFMQAVLAKGLQCNVIMYDYSGYGESGGVPLEHNTYKDIELVYKYALEHVVQDGVEKNVIIYGQSVGSGPSCYLCAKKPKVGGLILHSPFMSGMRVLTPSRILACLDIFPNIDRIKRVQCPVMIIHGARDEEVPINHGKGLDAAVPSELRRPAWWVSDRGHNNVTDGRANLIEYIERLNRFMESLE